MPLGTLFVPQPGPLACLEWSVQGGGCVWEVGLEPPAPLLCAPPHPCLLCGAQSLPVPHHVTPSLSPDPPCPSQWQTLLRPLLGTWGGLTKGPCPARGGLVSPCLSPNLPAPHGTLGPSSGPAPPHSSIDGSRDGAGSDLGRPGPLLVLGWQQVGKTREDSHTLSSHPVPPIPACDCQLLSGNPAAAQVHVIKPAIPPN